MTTTTTTITTLKVRNNNFISQHNVYKKDKVTFRYTHSNLESCETDACTKLWACVTGRQVQDSRKG